MKRIVLIMACLFFLGITNATAEVQLKKHNLDAGAEISYIRYKEPGVMWESGMMYGLTGVYAYHNAIMLKAEGRGAFGTVDYKNSGTMKDIDDYILEFRGLGGYDFPLFKASILTPYIGFGYRYLNDDLRGTTSTGAQGYERESNYLYSPIGIETITELSQGWSIGCSLEYDIFWLGIQRSHFSDADSAFSDLDNDQHRGYGLRGSLRVQKKAGNMEFVIEPFIRYWNIRKSDEKIVTYSGLVYAYGYEPKNNSTEVGVKFALKY